MLCGPLCGSVRLLSRYGAHGEAQARARVPDRAVNVNRINIGVSWRHAAAQKSGPKAVPKRSTDIAIRLSVCNCFAFAKGFGACCRHQLAPAVALWLCSRLAGSAQTPPAPGSRRPVLMYKSADTFTPPVPPCLKTTTAIKFLKIGELQNGWQGAKETNPSGRGRQRRR